jgi:predicted phosphodiesterase
VSLKYFWLTDTHFNFLSKEKLISYFIEIQSRHPDGIFLTGDISTGSQLIQHLQWMSGIIHCPIYFVLGNHDFYRSDFLTVNQSIISLMKTNKNLLYLNICDPITLSKNVGIIGDNGWYDARWREPHTSLVFCFDYFFIKDFRSLIFNKDRLSLVRQKADESALHIEFKLRDALKEYSTVYLLTHIPPWPESQNNWGGLESKFWMPYNSSKVTADMLLAIMDENPNKKLIILSGHVHAKKTYTKYISHNIECVIGQADRNVETISLPDII